MRTRAATLSLGLGVKEGFSLDRKLQSENFEWDNFASDRLIDWISDNLTEDDFEEELGSLMGCSCESTPKTIGACYISDSSEKWEDWMEQEGNEENFIAVYYCFKCKIWAVDCDF